MTWQKIPFIISLIAGAVTSAALAYYLWRNRQHRARAEKSLREAHESLTRCNLQLAGILATGNSLRLNLDLDSMLQEILEGIQRSLGFGIVTLNMDNSESEQLRVQAQTGLDQEARHLFEDALYTWEDFAPLMQDQFRVGRCYFIPHGALDQGPTYPALRPDSTSDGAENNTWHADDALLVPIELRRGQTVGVISVDQPLDGKRPNQETFQALEIFANMAAVAIENAHLYARAKQELKERERTEKALLKLNQDLEKRVSERTAELSRANVQLQHEVDERKQTEAELLRRNRELLSLQAAAVATTSSLDIQFVLETVTWEMAGLLSVEGCAISEWDQETDTLSVLADYGPRARTQEELGNPTYDLADCPFKKQVLRERYAQQLTIGQSNLDPVEAAHMKQTGIKTLLMLPMVYQEKVIGLVEMRDGQVERTFTDHEISLAQLLANQTASAIENARLYEQAQQEITERLRAEELIKASLKEKELLLQEIHHRVKNNLQVISSLLNLQSKGIEDRSALELFKESQNRVRSMALIHEKLYRSRDLARIDFAEYVRNLASFLIRSYRSDSGPVRLEVNARDVFLGIDSAVPCGLIINELISNALKHAFPPDRGSSPARDTSTSGTDRLVGGDGLNGKESEIRVELYADHDRHLTLVVGDNGVGFPEDLDFRNTESLGMQLVNTLVSQLGGKVELSNNGGTEFKITFPVP